MGLGRVFEHLKTMGPSDSQNGPHLRRLSIEVHRYDGFGASRHGALYLGRVDIPRPWVRLDGHRDRPTGAHGEPRCDIGVGGDDDLVFFSNPHGPQCQMQGVESGGDTHTESRADVGGECLFETLDLLAQDITAAAHNPGHRFVDIGPELSRGRRQIKERDLQRNSPRASFGRHDRLSSAIG